MKNKNKNKKYLYKEFTFFTRKFEFKFDDNGNKKKELVSIPHFAAVQWDCNKQQYTIHIEDHDIFSVLEKTKLRGVGAATLSSIIRHSGIGFSAARAAIDKENNVIVLSLIGKEVCHE